MDEEPKLNDLLDDEIDADRALDIAFDDVVKRIAAVTQGRAWTYIGPQSFKQATIFAAQRNLYRRQPGDTAEELYLRYQKELTDELERVTAGTAWRDADQDGVVEEHEQPRIRSVRISRG